MNRMLRAIIGVVFVGIIMFSAISICQNIGRTKRLDITEEKLYTLSDGTKAILGKINQPIKLKLYYTKTAAMKASDQIKFYINYYYFVRALLEEYERAAGGMVHFEEIDPRPFSDEEEEALRYDLETFPITQEERFIFGLLVQTPFGVTKSIPFFTPDRQNFVEYDISYLIDQAITRRKRKIGVVSSLPVMGEDVTGYMAQMMQLQGQNPKPPWAIISHFQQKYDVSKVDNDMVEVPSDIDILMVIHPKDLPEKSLWAIDQFVLKGGRAIVLVDPHSVIDMPAPQQRMMRQAHTSGSDLNRLLRMWGLEMPAETYAGDRELAITTSLSRGRRAQKIIGFLELKPGCFNTQHVISSELKQVRLLFPGALREVDRSETNDNVVQEENDTGDTASPIELTPLLMSTEKGNTWTADPSEMAMSMRFPERLMHNFSDGNKPVYMGYLATGTFGSAFPNGIKIQEESDSEDNEAKKEEDKKTKTKTITGLTESAEGVACAVAVFADVDFIADFVAFQSFGPFRSVVGDNIALLENTIEALSGSGDLISIRSRGSVKRPFTVVDEIETAADKDTHKEVAKLQAEINGYVRELNELKASSQKQERGALESSVLQKIREIQNAQRKTEKRLRQVSSGRLKGIEKLGTKLKIINMVLAPAIILIIAIVLGIRRSVRRRHYISHASDA